MSKLQQVFTEILKEKKRVIGKSKYTIQRWANGSTSPTIETLEKVCIDNEIELPFFFNGKIESLIEYNKQIGGKMGFKIQLIFES
jgi:transcriptional regulator with XRE-family HTH domain